MPAVSVIMPTFKQRHFIRRALESLCAQSLADWELWIIDDGSPDGTEQEVQAYLGDPRIHYHKLEQNQGMGAAINTGLDLSHGQLIAYLPSDDVYYSDHLASLAECLEHNPLAVAAFSGVRYHYNRSTPGQIEGFALQPVQVMHRRTSDRWVERPELVTDDMERMYWKKLRQQGTFEATGLVTCEWVEHPHQRHHLLREPIGGINPYRRYTGASQPLRYQTTVGNEIDEVEYYRRFRDRPDTPVAQDSLKILLLGELAYNPERVLALEELGHKLYGLWMPDPHWYNTVGPLPFGHVEDIPFDGRQEAIERIMPDLIYAQLNWQAVPFIRQVLLENPGIPSVWHFKEGPFICLEKGTWSEMVDIYHLSDGQIYTSPEMRDWSETAMPGVVSRGFPYVLDGDLPKKEWFTGSLSPRLSERDGEFHTVVPGRPIGLHPPNVKELADNRIHLHFYGDFTHGQWLEWIEKTRRLAPDHIHLHSHVDQRNWVLEFSQYDAGWLHYFRSQNQGDIRRANWDDLNIPARLATLAAAGLPVLQYNNSGAVVATQSLVQAMDTGLFFRNMEELAHQLSDSARMEQIRTNVCRQRDQFTFDAHASRLVDYFRKVIDRRLSGVRREHSLNGTP